MGMDVDMDINIAVRNLLEHISGIQSVRYRNEKTIDKIQAPEKRLCRR